MFNRIRNGAIDIQRTTSQVLKCIALAIVAFASPSYSQTIGSFQILLSNNDVIPGTEDRIVFPIDTEYFINDAGIISFLSFRNRANGLVSLYTLNRGATPQLRSIITTQQATPDLDGRVDTINYWSVANDGLVNVATRLENTISNGNDAIYRINSSGQLIQVIREGNPLTQNLPPIANGGFFNPGVSWNSRGDMFIYPDIVDITNESIYSISATGMANELIRPGTPISGTTYTLSSIEDSPNFYEGSTGYLFSNDNNVFFIGRDTSNTRDEYWYRHSNLGLQRLTEARNDRYAYAGQDSLFFTWDELTSEITQIDSNNETADVMFSPGILLPNGDGRFLELHTVDISEKGQTVALAELTATPSGTSDDFGLYYIDNNEIIEIAREGQAAIVESSIFRRFITGGNNQLEDASINSSGQIIFVAEYILNGRAATGLFYYDRSSGLHEILNRNSTIEGLGVESFSFPNSINDRGEVVFTARLSDGQSHLILFQASPVAPPPPPSFSISPGISGTWFDPEQSGHGLTIEILPGQRMLAAWFTFDSEGNQAWFGGAGSYSGNSATMDFALPTGGRFIPNFDPNQVVRNPWGSATITFDSCNSGRIDFSSSLPGYNSGSMELSRLTQLDGINCN